MRNLGVVSLIKRNNDVVAYYGGSRTSFVQSYEMNSDNIGSWNTMNKEYDIIGVLIEGL